MAALVDSLKRLENEIYGRYGNQDNVLIEVARIAHRQFIWQGNPPNANSIARYYTIFNTDEINAVARDQLGLSVHEIYLCATTFMGSLLSFPAVRLPVRSGIKELPAETFARFVSWCAKDVPSIREMLRTETKHDDTFAYSYSSLRRWPLIAARDAVGPIVLCPLPTLLYWRYTAGLYYDLIGDSRFANALGTSFQNYIGKVLDRSSRTGRLQVLPEQAYGSKKARKQSVDWIVYDGKDAVFVECKSKRISTAAKAALTDLTALTTDIQGLAASVVQVYKTLADHLNGQYPHFPYRKECGIYPMVVTLENWRLFGPRLVSILSLAVSDQMKQAGLPEEWTTTFPYSVVATDEAEAIFQVADSMGIANFLDGKCRNPDMSGWEWSGYARHINPGFEYSALFGNEYKAVFSELLRGEPVEQALCEIACDDQTT